jgi:hypothetical protein
MMQDIWGGHVCACRATVEHNINQPRPSGSLTVYYKVEYKMDRQPLSCLFVLMFEVQ